MKIPSADKTHSWANLIVGFFIPRWWVRKLSLRKRRKLVEYVRYIWLKANDNNPRRVEKPAWLPKKYIWPPKGYKYG